MGAVEDPQLPIGTGFRLLWARRICFPFSSLYSPLMLARSTISLFLLTQHLEEVLGGAPAIQTLGQQRAKDTNPRAFQAFLRYSKKTPTLRIPGDH